MKYSAVLAATVAALTQTSAAQAVSGAAEGFAKGVTGGGDATPVYPTTTDELISYLSDSEARVIVINKEFNFIGTEGTATGAGCAPWTCSSGGQYAIDQNDWCENYEPDAPSTTITYDKAGVLGMTVASDKTIIGEGSSGIIKGKGLRMVSGASNIIIQNIEITDINPEFVWGGDAITINDADMIWIDHVTTSLIGRQHIVLGTESSGRVSITNNYINGYTSYSATCDEHTYWAIYLDGSNDLVTMKGNYIYYTSGRSPKVGGNTLLHAVNNYWYDNSGHAFEVGEGAYIVMEGNVFQNVDTVIEDSIEGEIFTSPSTTENEACANYLGHDCVLNAFGSSTTTTVSDTGFFSDFEGKNIASAASADTVVQSVTSNAGAGILTY